MRLALLLVVLAAACGRPAPASRVVPSPGGVIGSNMLRADYAGSKACSECHRELYDRWAASPMRNMTRDAATANIRAPFDGATLHVDMRPTRTSHRASSRRARSLA